MKQPIWLTALVAASFALGQTTAQAQLPANFPTVTVTTNYAPAVAAGYIFEGNNIAPTNVGFYAAIYGNDGAPTWYRELTNSCWDFKVLPNGYLHYAQQLKALPYTGGGDVTHQILDENYQDVETIKAGNGYSAEAHDFKMLPNGHALLFGYYLSEVDMSQVVPNGNPGAQVSGAVLQELDAQRNVIFQWRSWDHYPFTSNWVNSTAAVISEFHINCIFQDTDGHLVVSTPDWIKKINRQTGQIMWHLGGTENQFTFVGVTQQEGTNQFRTHGVNRLPNGHILVYNNSVSGVAGSSSSAREYALDEVNKIATHIWTYTPNPAIPGPFQGYAERLTNGNTFIGWGGLPGVTPFDCTEVAGTNVVFQMKFNNPGVICYRSYRFPFPSSSQADSASLLELAAGNSYSFGDTGVSLDVASGGGGYNRVTVTREPYSPVYPLFQGKAPRVLPVRVKLGDVSVNNLSVTVNFDVAGFGLSNPAGINVHYRPQSGQGLFSPQTTVYNSAAGQLQVTLDLQGQSGDMGEFIFTYPDLPDLSFPPLLAQAESYRGFQTFNIIAPKPAAAGVTYAVNQLRPVFLSWSPQGLASYYEFEISTHADFSNPLVSVPYQTDAFYVWNGGAPGTTYYYHVRTWNDAGVSEWTDGAFNTTAPLITVAAPNPGAQWHRGLKYFVQWHANIAENVKIDLYKGGVFFSTIATNTPNTGAFQWQVGSALAAGADYSIKISSTANGALFDVSDAPFNIDVPVIDGRSFARLANGNVNFGFTAPGATNATVLGSTNLIDWQILQAVNLTNGAGTFNDGTAANLPIRFYRIRLP